MAPTITYFPARGRTDLSRFILEHAAVQYEFKEINRESLPELKASGHLPFGQLPIYEEDDGFLIAQSLAIARYLARKNGLYGADERQGALVDQFVDGIVDLQNKVIPFIYPVLKKEEAEAFFTNDAPKWLDSLERLAIKAGATADSGFATGSLTFADFFLFLLLESTDAHIDPSKWTILNGIRSRVAGLPNIAAYISSDRRPPPFKPQQQ